MNIEMVKMAKDIDKTRNHRIRGIVPTEDKKYLFIEISIGYRLDKKYFPEMSNDEYEEKYPYIEYIMVDHCFRVDKPIDYCNEYSLEYVKYERNPFYNLQHSKENIIKVLQIFNKSIEDITLISINYIDKYCESKGFFKAYDNRIKHSYEPVEITQSYDEGTKVKFLYTCYSYRGEKFENK